MTARNNKKRALLLLILFFFIETLVDNITTKGFSLANFKFQKLNSIKTT